MYGSSSETWIIPAELGQEKVIMQKIAQAISIFPESEPRLHDILTCAAEACLNAIEHGSGLNIKRYVTVSFYIEDNHFTLRIYDEGLGFSLRPEKIQLKEKLKETNPRGWGLFLIHRLADEVCTGTEDGLFFIQMNFPRHKEGGKNHE